MTTPDNPFATALPQAAAVDAHTQLGRRRPRPRTTGAPTSAAATARHLSPAPDPEPVPEAASAAAGTGSAPEPVPAPVPEPVPPRTGLRALPALADIPDVEPPAFYAERYGTGADDGAAVAPAIGDEPDPVPDPVPHDDDYYPDDYDDDEPAGWSAAVGEAAHGDPVALTSDHRGEWTDWVSVDAPGAYTDGPRPRQSVPVSVGADPDADMWEVPDYDAEDAEEQAAERARFNRYNRPAGPAPARTMRGRSAGGMVGALAIAAVVVTVVAVVVMVNVKAQSGSDAAAVAPPTAVMTAAVGGGAPETTAPPSSWGHATPSCAKVSTTSLTSGAGPGDDGTPQGAILAFQWGYYVERSAEKAWGQLAQGVDLPAKTPDGLQKFIDEVPVGTRYCVRITPGTGAGVWQVELDELWPGEPVQRWSQRVTTVNDGGRAVITGITAE